VSESGELSSLKDLGIVAINLTRTSTGEVTLGAQDNVVTATSHFVRADGTTGLVGDVALATPASIATTTSDQGNALAQVNRGAQSPPSFSRYDVNGKAVDLNASARGSNESDANPTAAESEEDSPAAQENARSPDRSPPTRDTAGAENAWEPQTPAAAPGALHASLDLIARRRLQMIEAMASFSAEGAASLELQPHRRIDPRTYELLTAVSLTRNVA
jgi:hypothetical protein